MQEVEFVLQLNRTWDDYARELLLATSDSHALMIPKRGDDDEQQRLEVLMEKVSQRAKQLFDSSPLGLPYLPGLNTVEEMDGGVEETTQQGIFEKVYTKLECLLFFDAFCLTENQTVGTPVRKQNGVRASASSSNPSEPRKKEPSLWFCHFLMDIGFFFFFFFHRP